MKRQRRTVGSILAIKLSNDYFTYAQILKEGLVFFDYFIRVPIQNFEILEYKEPVFFLSVYKDIITRGKWLKVSKLAIRESFETVPMQYIQDKLNESNYEFYNPNTGEVTPATKEECEGLEVAAVWDAHHVEERLLNHFLRTKKV